MKGRTAVLVTAALLAASVSAAPATAGRGRTGQTIRFAGLTWDVKTGPTPQGPGPNLFSDSTQDVWVDARGFLHLRIAHRDGHWYCAEVIARGTFAYGTYVFHLAGRIDRFDPNVVLGLFTWSDAPAQFHREIYVELSRWGDPLNEDAQDVVQPYQVPGRIHRFEADLAGQASTHSFRWSAGSVRFRSAQGSNAAGPLIDAWTFGGPGVPTPGDQVPHLNLWLDGGHPPADGEDAEMVVTGFDYVPLATAGRATGP